MNVLILPEKFDYNEWILIISLIVAYTLIIRLPRRFPHTTTIMIFLFSLSLEKIADLIFEYPPYSLYYLNDSSKYELFDFLTCFLYPASGYLFLYFYDKWNIRGFSTIIYLLSWSIISIIFEGITVLAHVFNYTGWKLLYSYPVYLIVISLYVLFYHFVKYIYMQTKLKG